MPHIQGVPPPPESPFKFAVYTSLPAEFVDKLKAESEGGDPLFGKKTDFEVDYKQGAPPVLHLYDADGNEATDPISISQWKTEHMVDFLTAKLVEATS